MTLNLCQFGHTFHESKIVETQVGPLHIWDWERYRSQAGYCTGQDDVSMSLDLYGTWERPDIARFNQILDEQPGLVLDFGAHIGWYVVNAMKRGCALIAVEADPENCRLLQDNLRSQKWADAVWNEWVVDFEMPLGMESQPVRILKSDVEGHEHEVLDKTRHLWQERLIDYGLWELSPVFENRENINSPSYRALVEEIASYGYRWSIIKDEGDWLFTPDEMTWPQENGWCERI